MKSRKIVPIGILTLIYAYVIITTLRLFYFPNSEFSLDLSLIRQDLIQYTLIIEIIIILMALSVVPAFFISMKQFKELKTEKIPIMTIVVFSIIPAGLALLNDVLTGNILLSIGLLIYGIIFTVLVYKFR